jgi:hypothetical protein
MSTTLADAVGRRSARLSTLRSLALMLRFAVANVVSRRSILDPAGPDVSLTSYGRRVHLVFLAIESIARGTRRPSRVILWLDDQRYLASPPRSLRRLERRGLEIRASANYGPHTKYFPYARSKSSHAVPVVTADDDWMVPARWLETLLAAHSADPRAVVAHRAHLITVTGGSIAPYGTWGEAIRSVTSPQHFSTGCMGQLLPAHILDSLRDAGESFRDSTPHNDDVWIHHLALESGTGVRPVGQLDESEFAPIRGGGLGGVEPLFHSNVIGGRNDSQIAATYSRRGVEAVVAASRA